MARTNQYDFKCSQCGTVIEMWQDADKVRDGWVPPCTHCDTKEHVRRVWTFGQFTFEGGLPSNAGRDPNKIWR